MACIQPDGLLTRCGESVLLAMWAPANLEYVAKECRVPLFRVRAAAREFLDAGFIRKNGDQYVVTASGIEKMEG
jgi:predicted transcriptional regulator